MRHLIYDTAIPQGLCAGGSWNESLYAATMEDLVLPSACILCLTQAQGRRVGIIIFIES